MRKRDEEGENARHWENVERCREAKRRGGGTWKGANNGAHDLRGVPGERTDFKCFQRLTCTFLPLATMPISRTALAPKAYRVMYVKLLQLVHEAGRPSMENTFSFVSETEGKILIRE